MNMDRNPGNRAPYAIREYLNSFKEEGGREGERERMRVRIRVRDGETMRGTDSDTLRDGEGWRGRK
jgi:hypothetical protein